MFSNLVLDLVDFKDRVRPLARDIALMDVSRQYQKHSIRDIMEEKSNLVDSVSKLQAALEKEALEEGYSSRELEGPDSAQRR